MICKFVDGVFIRISIAGYQSESLGKEFYVKSNEYFTVTVEVKNISAAPIYRIVRTDCSPDDPPHTHDDSLDLSFGIPLEQYSGTTLIGELSKERESIEEPLQKIGISFYDIETGEQRIFVKEDFGLDYYPHFLYATDEYIYFERPVILCIGTELIDRGGQKVEHRVQKLSDGKLYRMNADGTDIVCVYDNPDYELNDNMIIYGDKVVMQGQYVTFENGEKKIWGGPIQVATINPDGTFGEFVEVEVLQ